MRVVGVIPARYHSTRLPGKPLADICGKPMVWWVYRQAKKVSQFEEVYVATDDARIFDLCNAHSIPVVMTSETHRTAAHRLQEFSEKEKADFYVQINGDEPLIDPSSIAAVIPEDIPENIEFGTNIITEIDDPAQLVDASNIKVVFDQKLRALYMSRTPIPYPFSSIKFQYYKHVGIIGYNKRMLDLYRDTEPGNLELIEGIDTLRFIDYGKMLQFVIVSGHQTLSVDTTKDLERVREIMAFRLSLGNEGE